MKRNIITVFALAVLAVSCQKNIETPASQRVNSSSSNNIEVSGKVPIAKFAQPLDYRKIVTTKTDVIFSDSLSITEGNSFLQFLKFDVKGTGLSFNNCTLLINGVRIPITGNYTNNILSIVLNKTRSLPVGNYYIEIKAKVTCNALVFTMGLQPGNAVITDRYGFMAIINGLPLKSSIATQ